MANSFGLPASGSTSPPSNGRGHNHSHSASMSIGSPHGYGQPTGPDGAGSTPQSSTFIPAGAVAPPNSLAPVPSLGSVSAPQREGQLRRGVCKFFNSQKGFGFVLDNNSEELGGQEVFVHFTAIQSKTGFRSLAEGEEVEYEITTGAKGFQAVRLTGPGGRPVVGDPKARLMDPSKQGGQFMQMPVGFQQGPYGMEPYMPQPVYAASPYASHVLYVPQAMHPNQQAQYAQMMGANGQYPMQMNQYGAQQNRQGMMGNNQQQPQGNPFGQNTSGSFGPVGGMGSAGGMGTYGQQQNNGNSYQGNAGAGYNQGAGASRYGGAGLGNLENEGFGGFGSGHGGQEGGQDNNGAGQSNSSFFGSSLYSNN